jgi:hypothetical protein
MANDGYGNAFKPRVALDLFKDAMPPKNPCAICGFAKCNKRHKLPASRMDSHEFLDEKDLIE